MASLTVMMSVREAPDLFLVQFLELRANKDISRTNIHIQVIPTVQITPSTYIYNSNTFLFVTHFTFETNLKVLQGRNSNIKDR